MENKKKLATRLKDVFHNVFSGFRDEKIQPNYVTKSELINGKRIEVRIWVYHFKDYNKKLVKQLEKEFKYRSDKGGLEVLREFFLARYGDLFTGLVFGACFDSAKEFIDLIQVNHLQINIAADLGMHTASLVTGMSTIDKATIAIYPPYITAKIIEEYSRYDGRILKIFSEFEHFTSWDPTPLSQLRTYIYPKQEFLKERIKDVIRHEFIHYLDIEKIEKGIELIKHVRDVADTAVNGMRPLSLSRPLTPEVLVNSIVKLRSEGIATFGQSRQEYLAYDIKKVRLFQNYLSQYSVGPILDLHDRLYYHVGSYMCYLISLGILLRSNKRKFNELKVCFDENCEDFVFFAEGFPKIFEIIREKNLEKVFFQKPKKSMIKESIRQLRQTDHLAFIKLYENACQLISLPEDQVLMTMQVYNRLKQKNYQYWVENVKGKI